MNIIMGWDTINTKMWLDVICGVYHALTLVDNTCHSHIQMSRPIALG